MARDKNDAAGTESGSDLPRDMRVKPNARLNTKGMLSLGPHRGVVAEKFGVQQTPAVSVLRVGIDFESSIGVRMVERGFARENGAKHHDVFAAAAETVASRVKEGRRQRP